MSFKTTHPGQILYDNRVLFLFGTIDADAASQVVPALLVMDSLGDAPITLYINSPGGELTAGLAIYDTIQFTHAPVYTVCIGQAASMAAWLLAAGAKGHRAASANARIMIHQLMTGVGGSYTDLKVAMDEVTRSYERLQQILAQHCDKTAEEIELAIQRDRWMSSDEAQEFGIIDRVVGVAEGS